MAREIAYHIGREIARHVAREIARHMGKEIACHIDREIARHMGREIACHIDREIARHAGRAIARQTRKQPPKLWLSTSLQKINNNNNNKLVSPAHQSTLARFAATPHCIDTDIPQANQVNVK